jgi:hypothetical protein
MMMKKKKIKLCAHLEVEKPETKNGLPAKLQCGQCSKVWIWNAEEKAYVCIVDPEKDEKLNMVGKLFREGK